MLAVPVKLTAEPPLWVTLMRIAYLPGCANSWVPLTENLPRPLDTTTPREFADPSPQSINAVKPLVAAALSLSENLPTTTLFSRKAFEVDSVRGEPAVIGVLATMSSAPPLPEISIELTCF